MRCHTDLDQLAAVGWLVLLQVKVEVRAATNLGENVVREKEYLSAMIASCATEDAARML